MNNKFFRVFGIVIIILNTIIFSLFSYYLFSIKNYNIIVIISIPSIFMVNIFFSLIVYSSMNKKFEDVFFKYKENWNSKDLMLKKNPIGTIIVDYNGIVRYANQAIKDILCVTNIIGINILELSKEKNTRVYNGILMAMQGVSTENKNENYIFHDSDKKKYLNIYIFPEFDLKNNKVKNIILMINDVTEEVNLKSKVESTYISTIEALAALVDAKDKYTGEHSKNVSKYVSFICDNISCDRKEEKENVNIAAKFHDLGKIGIPDYILNKPGKLSHDEFEIMKKHPDIGADILKKIDKFNSISNIIRYHHERFDGTGYPCGLKGDEIPFGSQIISIADTYDAITSDRVYRKGLGKEVAIKILLEERGRQFNSGFVDVFIRALNKESNE